MLLSQSTWSWVTYEDWKCSLQSFEAEHSDESGSRGKILEDQYFSQDGILKTASFRRKGHSVLMWQKVRGQRSHHQSPSNLFTRADPSRPETLIVASLTNVLSWVWIFSHTDLRSSGAIKPSNMFLVIDTCSRAPWISPLALLEEKLKIYVDGMSFKASYNDEKVSVLSDYARLQIVLSCTVSCELTCWPVSAAQHVNRASSCVSFPFTFI